MFQSIQLIHKKSIILTDFILPPSSFCFTSNSCLSLVVSLMMSILKKGENHNKGFIDFKVYGSKIIIFSLAFYLFLPKYKYIIHITILLLLYLSNFFVLTQNILLWIRIGVCIFISSTAVYRLFGKLILCFIKLHHLQLTLFFSVVRCS